MTNQSQESGPEKDGAKHPNPRVHLDLVTQAISLNDFPPQHAMLCARARLMEIAAWAVAIDELAESSGQEGKMADSALEVFTTSVEQARGRKEDNEPLNAGDAIKAFEEMLKDADEQG